MKLDKAIEILDLKLKQNVFQVDPDAKVALALGLEGLTAIQAYRMDWAGNRFDLLPGETDPPPRIIPARLLFGHNPTSAVRSG